MMYEIPMLPTDIPTVLARPAIVCLCGSTRFFEEFQRLNFEFTMLGLIVLTVGFYPHANINKNEHGQLIGITAGQKAALDRLHKKKIDMADCIYVINKGGYVGYSTASEIRHAMDTGKDIYFMERRQQSMEISI